MQFCRTLSGFVFCLALLQSSLLPVVLAGTRIATTQGAIPVERLTKSHEVIGYTQDSGRVLSFACALEYVTAPSYYVIATSRGECLVAHDALLYDPVANSWVLAQDVTRQTHFLHISGEHVICFKAEHCNHPMPAFNLSLSQPHTFFAHGAQILVHNIVPVIGAAIAWGGGGGLVFEGITIGLACLGGAILGKLFGKEKMEDRATCSVRVDDLIESLRPKHWQKPDEKKEVKESEKPKKEKQEIALNRDKVGDKQKKERERKAVKEGKKEKKEKKNKQPDGDGKDPNHKKDLKPEKEDRKINDLEKAEFMKEHKIHERYKHLRNGVFERNKDAKGVHPDAEYIKWDAMHKDVEVFNRAGDHRGSMCARTCRIYRTADPTRSVWDYLN